MNVASLGTSSVFISISHERYILSLYQQFWTVLPPLFLLMQRLVKPKRR